MLTEKAALVSSVRELKLKVSGVTENNNNNNHRHRHRQLQQLQSDDSRVTLCARCSVLEGEQEDPLNFILPLLDGVWSLILRKVSTLISDCFELFFSAFSPPPPPPPPPCPGWTSCCSPPAWPPSCWAWCPPWLPWWPDNLVFLSHQKCQK